VPVNGQFDSLIGLTSYDINMPYVRSYGRNTYDVSDVIKK